MKQISIYIGLKTRNMKANITPKTALKKATTELKKVGIIGFNAQTIKGLWKGKAEKCLNISFINNFGTSKADIVTATENIKTALNQESILITEQATGYSFI